MKRLLYILLLFPAFLRAQSINISTPSSTICIGSSVHFTAVGSGIPDPHYHWKVNGINAGHDSTGFVTNALVNGDSVVCLLANGSSGTVSATSNSIIITVQVMPHAAPITGSDTACYTGTITTLSDAVPGGVWSASNPKASVSAGGVLTANIFSYAGVYDTIYYVVTNSCGVDTAAVTITITTMPHIEFGLSDAGVCIGQLVDIGGDYGTPTIEYASNDNASITNSIVYGQTAGLDTIYGVTPSYCGSDTTVALISVTSRPLPPVVTPIFGQSTNVCVGAILNLHDSTGGSPVWSASNGNAIVNYGTITGISPGLDTISLSIEYEYCGAGAFATVPQIVITIDSSAPILNPGNACAGQPVILFNSVAGGVWRNGNPRVATVKPGPIQPGTAVVTTISPGVDTVFYTLPNGCVVNTPVLVTPYPAPISGTDIYCIGERMNLADTGLGIWSTKDSGFVFLDSGVAFMDSFLNTIVITGTKAGISTITYTYPTGCSVSKQIHIVDCGKEVTIFPNPVNGELIIEADTSNYTSYTIINCLGQVVTHGQLTQQITEINSWAWPVGIYLVHLEGESTFISRLLKE